ncbi:hypothetical protein N665_0071s0058 [Sinapis alba]|nr:hypothetical protein N665_0071s0058 [Sinapis alba]
MCVPVWVNCSHWIALCISFVNRYIEVFDCGGRQNHKEVKAFMFLVPWIVKVVHSLRMQKHINITPYNVSYVLMRGLNQTGCDCSFFTIKHIECHFLVLELSLVDDDNIKGARTKIMWDIWEAATDP